LIPTADSSRYGVGAVIGGGGGLKKTGGGGGGGTGEQKFKVLCSKPDREKSGNLKELPLRSSGDLGETMNGF